VTASRASSSRPGENGQFPMLLLYLPLFLEWHRLASADEAMTAVLHQPEYDVRRGTIHAYTPMPPR